MTFIISPSKKCIEKLLGYVMLCGKRIKSCCEYYIFQREIDLSRNCERVCVKCFLM